MEELSRLSPVVLVLLGLISVVTAHVRLTYPEARYVDIDFLDNVRTKSPCGVPAIPGKDYITKLHSGMQFNVTWHLSYSHRGGYQLQILEGKKVAKWLTPKDQWLGSQDVTAQSHLVTIPSDYTCDQCTLRLLRQASEWSPRYQFWSCAEVTIKEDPTIDCSGQTVENGQCKCEHLYSGPNCQYKDECFTNADCNGHGKCIDIDATSYPKKQCFCEKGWFGINCELESPVKDITPPDQRMSYISKQLKADYNIFYKVLEDIGEIEVILEAKSTTWLGIGWRPLYMGDQCKNFPNLNIARDANGKPEPEVEPEGTGEPHPGGKAEGTAEPHAEGEGTPEPEHGHSEPEGTGEPESEGKAEGIGEPNPEGKAEGTAEPHAEGEGTPEPEHGHSEPEGTGEPHPEGKAEGTAEPHAEGEGTPEPEHGQSEPEPEVETGPKVEPEGEPEAKGDNAGSYNYGCHNCNEYYHASWDFNKVEDTISFNIKTKVPMNTWVGIAFAREKKMQNGDVFLARIDSNNQRYYGDWQIGTRHQPPILDNQFDYTGDKFISYVNGMTYFNFTRKRDTKDLQDLKFGDEDNECYFFLYPYKGIPAGSDEYALTYHYGITPTISEKKICIRDVPHAEPEGEPEGEGEGEPEGKPEGEGEGEPEGKPEGEGEGEPEGKPEGDGHGEPEGKPEGDGHGKPEGEPEGESEPKGEPESEGEPEGGAEPESGSSNLHPMDCTDIIIGAAREGTLSRILDYYTRDRSTPRPDATYGGTQTLTAAVGEEKDGRTTILFRRKLTATERSDYTLAKGNMHVIYAKGQEIGNYIHKPASGIEVGASKDLQFYRRDELKYHGHGGQRGSDVINFQSKPVFNPCIQEFKSPAGCSGKNCKYHSSWVFDASADTITFTIKAKQPQNRWTGIAFGETRNMENLDVILGYIDSNGAPMISDSYISTRYTRPQIDGQSDITNSNIQYANGIYTFSFTRKRNTGDSNDKMFSDTDCYHFIFPVEGGSTAGGSIGKHGKTPIRTDEKICVKQCQAQERTVYVSLKSTTPWDSAYSDLNSPKSRDFIQKLKPGYEAALKNKVAATKNVVVRALREGSVWADMDIIVLTDGSQESYDNTMKNIEKATKEELSDGRVGTVEVDSNVYRVSTTPPDNRDETKRELKTLEIVLIVVICVLVFIALVILMVKCLESSRKGEECCGIGGRRKLYAMETKNGFTKTVL